MDRLSEESAKQITIEFLKKLKNTERIEVSMAEIEDDCWVIRGTSPMDFQGTEWPERFIVVVDQKGKIVSTDFALL